MINSSDEICKSKTKDYITRLFATPDCQTSCSSLMPNITFCHRPWMTESDTLASPAVRLAACVETSLSPYRILPKNSVDTTTTNTTTTNYITFTHTILNRIRKTRFLLTDDDTK